MADSENVGPGCGSCAAPVAERWFDRRRRLLVFVDDAAR
jgi:hypothetical protein